MADKVAKFLAGARAAGLIGAVPAGVPDLAADPLRACQALFPDRVCNYDAEAIDEPESYSGVLDLHARATAGEWVISDFGAEQEDELGETVTLRFDLSGDAVVWRLGEADSDWISEDFFRKVLAYGPRRLKGQFVQLPTEDQGVAFVYLPKTLARLLRSILEKPPKTANPADAFVQFFRKGGSYPHKLDHDECEEMANRHDSQGDTPLTAAIKANNAQGVFTLLEVFGSDPTVPDAQGRTPWELALAAPHRDVLAYMRTKAWAAMPKAATGTDRKSHLRIVMQTRTAESRAGIELNADDLKLVGELVAESAREGDKYPEGAAELYEHAALSDEVMAGSAITLLQDPDTRDWVVHRLLRSRRPWHDTFLRQLAQDYSRLDDEAFVGLVPRLIEAGLLSSDDDTLTHDLVRRVSASQDPDPTLVELLSATSKPTAIPVLRAIVGRASELSPDVVIAAAQGLVALEARPADDAEAIALAFLTGDAAALAEAVRKAPAAGVAWLADSSYKFARRNAEIFAVVKEIDDPAIALALVRQGTWDDREAIIARVREWGAPAIAALLAALEREAERAVVEDAEYCAAEELSRLVHVLSMLRVREAIRSILRLVSGGYRERGAGIAVRALANYGDPALIPEIMRFLTLRSETAHIQTIFALGNIEHPDALAALRSFAPMRRFAKDHERMVKRLAACLEGNTTAPRRKGAKRAPAG